MFVVMALATIMRFSNPLGLTTNFTLFKWNYLALGKRVITLRKIPTSLSNKQL